MCVRARSSVSLTNDIAFIVLTCRKRRRIRCHWMHVFNCSKLTCQIRWWPAYLQLPSKLSFDGELLSTLCCVDMCSQKWYPQQLCGTCAHFAWFEYWRKCTFLRPNVFISWTSRTVWVWIGPRRAPASRIGARCHRKSTFIQFCFELCGGSTLLDPSDL